MIEVVPAIIPQSLEDLSMKIEKVRGLVSTVQIDLLDGVFVPTRSWPFTEITDTALLGKALEEFKPVAGLHFQADLMVNSPESMLPSLVNSIFDTLIFHIESSNAHAELIRAAKEGQKRVGFALKPSTPLDLLSPWLSELDLVQCMGNDEIGYHGVALDPRVYERVQMLRSLKPDLPTSVDIGVNLETAPKLIAAGVTHLVSGSTVFGSDNIQETIAQLRGAH